MFPTEKGLIEFIQKNKMVNITIIAKHFGVNNVTASDLINSLEKKKVINTKKIGGSRFVFLK